MCPDVVHIRLFNREKTKYIFKLRFSALTPNAANNREQPYLLAVMFLQLVLSKKYGSKRTDYFPKPNSD